MSKFDKLDDNEVELVDIDLKADNWEERTEYDPSIAREFAEQSQKLNEQKHKASSGKAPPKKGKKKGKQEQEAPDLTAELDMDDHMIPLGELCDRFGVDINTGLSSTEAAARLERNGPNMLTPPKQVPEIIKFLKHIVGGFAILLWVGSLLCFISFGIDQKNQDNLYLGIVLACVIIITGCFAYYQDRSSDKVMAGFADMRPDNCIVIRDGNKVEVAPETLVLGDVVQLSGGNIVPADIRLIECNGIKVDNSSLTGESEAQPRSAEFTDENPLETRNLAFFTTNVNEGSGKGIVVRCGDATVIGRIAALVVETDSGDTPIHKEIIRFIWIISGVAIFLGVLFFIFGLFVYEPLTNLVFVIGIIVANVPEGLLATVTVALTLTAKRMAKKNVLVKNLESVETLGSTTNICSDKTGTLTLNQMTAAHLWYDGSIYTADLVAKGGFDKDSAVAKSLIRVCAINSKSTFLDGDNVPLNDRRVDGDASEAALMRWVQAQRDVQEYRSVCTQREIIPFNSSNKYMITINKSEDPNDPRWLLTMKGAPERVLEASNTILAKGDTNDDAVEVPLTDEWQEKYNKAYDTLGGMGERVLGFAHMYLDAETYPTDYPFDAGLEPPNFPMKGLCFDGLVSLIDPPRPTVPEAVRLCQSAGIKVTMVTGDHPKTAKAIAKQVGIITLPTIEDVAEEEGIPVDQVDKENVKAIVIHGATELRDMDDRELDYIVRHYQEIVFARTSPQQKLRIVDAYQRMKAIVAVTGDGVNDSPALKKADIGVAMGISGSQVSKKAADMILLDDNFASIVRGVEEGRLIFDNLKKSIAYTLSSNIPEIAPFIMFIILQVPLPLSTVLILCVDLGTDLLPAISLAYETKESDIMRRKPRNAEKDRLVNSRLIGFSYLQIGVIQAMAGIYVYLVVMAFYGFAPWALLGIADKWDHEDTLFRFIGKDLHLITVNHGYRRIALRSAQTCYFVTIVIVQWADLIICKTRKLSLFQQGMTNWVLNAGLIEETVLCAIIVYIPGLGTGLGTQPVPFQLWWPGIAFTIMIFTYDEVRKLLMRRSPGGWIEKHTYY